MNPFNNTEEQIIYSEVVQTQIMREDAGERTGFVQPAAQTIAYNETSRLFTVTPVSTEWSYYIVSEKYTVTATRTITIANTNGWHYVYMDTNTLLNETTTMTDNLLKSYLWIASVYLNTTDGNAVAQRNNMHGMNMAWETHRYILDTLGASYSSGLAISVTSVDGDGSSNDHYKLGLTAGEIQQQDIPVLITGASTVSLPTLYKHGSGYVWRRTAPLEVPLVISTGVPQRNLYSAGSYSLTNITDEYFVNVLIYACNDEVYPIYALCPEEEYETIDDARLAGADVDEISSISKDVKLAVVIYQYDSSYSNTYKVATTSVGVDNNYDLRNMSSGLIKKHSVLSGKDEDDHLQYTKVVGRVKENPLINGTFSLGDANSNDPVLTGSLALTSTQSRALAVDETRPYIYVAGYNTSIESIDVSVPETPVQGDYFDDSAYTRDLVVNGNYVYLTSDDGVNFGLGLVNVTDPTNITGITWDSRNKTVRITKADTYAYLMSTPLNAVDVYDVSTHGVPNYVVSFTGGLISGGQYGDIEVVDDFYFVGGDVNLIEVWDVSNKGAINKIESERLVSGNINRIPLLTMDGTRYIISCGVEIGIIDASTPSAITLYTSFSPSHTVEDAIAYEVNKNYYLAIGMGTNGTDIYDISDLDNIIQVYSLATYRALLYDNVHLYVSDSTFYLYDVRPAIEFSETDNGGKIVFPNKVTAEQSEIQHFHNDTFYDHWLGSSAVNRNTLYMSSLDDSKNEGDPTDDLVVVRSGKFVGECSQRWHIACGDRVYVVYASSGGTRTNPTDLIGSHQIYHEECRGHRYGGPLNRCTKRVYQNGNIELQTVIDDNDVTSTVQKIEGGVFTLPLQSGFKAYRNANQTINYTAVGSKTTIAFETELYDKKSEYIPSTGIFTAKKAGIYEISTLVRFHDTFGFVTYLYLQIIRNGSTIEMSCAFVPQPWLVGTYFEGQGTTCLELAATDTVVIKISIQGSQTNSGQVIGGSTISQFAIQKVA